MVANPTYFSLHTHSKYSVNDGLPEVADMVLRAKELGYPALALTDHRSVAGNIQLYTACRRAGIEPLPGIELNVAPEIGYSGRKDSMHLTMAAYSETGYRNLVHIATRTAQRYWYRPLVDMCDFAALAEANLTHGLAIGTGCYGGVLPRVLRNQGEQAARHVLETLLGWFPHVYVELMNHGITDFGDGSGWTDDDMCDALWDLAASVGAPVVVTRDSHYVDESDRGLHDGLKQLVSFGDDLDDAVFHGEGYWMTDAAGMRPFFEPHMLAAGLAGLDELANLAYVRLPELEEEFRLHVPDVTVGDADPQEVLESLVVEALSPAQRKSPAVMRRVRDEFDVTRHVGMAPYILLVNLVCGFMRDKGIRYAARGSAAGSYMLYALGVTQVDPLRFGLRFDRFLSDNRLKPPDVDLDVEHDRREEVVDFLTAKWVVRQVGSLMKYSLWPAEEGDESGGSLRVKYFSVQAKRGIAKTSWRAVPQADKDMLFALGDMRLISGYGTHAAGYIVAPNEEVASRLPLAYIPSSDKLVTAYGKKDVEKMGYLKLDLLGLRTQTAIRVALESSGVDWDAIPDADAATYKMIAGGDVAGVFQLDGRAMRRGCEQIRPRRLDDLIAAQALFRPATMRSGATTDWRARRSGREPVPKRHADITKATEETFGVLLYQEQVMDVMTSMQMSRAELEEMLDAVKASNEYSEGAAVAIEAMMPRIRELTHARGWTEVDIEWLAEALKAYADYSFNKAHAASYGLVAYRCAWLKRHHPNEFWLGMLVAFSDAPKSKDRPHPTITYARAARRDGVRILPPHVNHSGVTFTMDRSGVRPAIRKGLVTVKDVGPVAAAELAAKAPFTSLKDLGERVVHAKVHGARHLALGRTAEEAGSAMLRLDEAGALEGLE